MRLLSSVRAIAGTGLLAVLLLASGCQRVPPAEAPGVARELPEAPALPVGSGVHYRVDSTVSELRILVFRGGPLAEFGHNHVIVAGAISGDVYLTPSFHDSGFRLRIPVADLKVDPPAARKAEGDEFATELSDQAKDATRRNMLGPDVLDAQTYPDIEIRSVTLGGDESMPDMTVRITLHGVARDMTLPVTVKRERDRLQVNGETDLKQTDFGIKPFSVMGGGLRVQDRITVRFRITAVRREE